VFTFEQQRSTKNKKTAEELVILRLLKVNDGSKRKIASESEALTNVLLL
jgi:hypothetical protein